MSTRIYPKLPTTSEFSGDQKNFNAGTINSEMNELIKLKGKFGKKYKKYKGVLSKLGALNAVSSTLTVGKGISAIATSASIVGIPVSAGPGGVALCCSICSGVTSAVTKKYQNKFNKVMKLITIVLSSIKVFEKGISKSLEDGEIDTKEFEILQESYLETLDKVGAVDGKMKIETRNQFERDLMEELKNIKKNLIIRNK